MIKKRRPKGMGSVTYLGKGRRKPYLAIINKQCLGTFRDQSGAEKALLKYVLDQEDLFPSYTGESDTMKIKFTDYIYDMQYKRIINASILDIEQEYMSTFYDLFKALLISKGNLIESTSTNEILLTDDAPTFEEIWDIELQRLIVGKSNSWKYSFQAAFKSLTPLHKLKITQIRTKELQTTFDKVIADTKCGKSKLNNMCILCGRVFDYALKMDFVNKDYTQFITWTPNADPKNQRIPFSMEEIKLLMKNDTDIAKKVLLYIFTGTRPIELINIDRRDIYLDDHYMIGGAKTQAGKNRIIPIHPLIQPIVKYFIEKYDYGFLFTETSNKREYTEYLSAYRDLMKELKLESKHIEPYDTRYTFSTLAKTNRVDTSAHKKIMGHLCNDITDDIYTHEPIEYLYEEVKKIKIT